VLDSRDGDAIRWLGVVLFASGGALDARDGKLYVAQSTGTAEHAAI
jgi:hypothetical protein